MNLKSEEHVQPYKRVNQYVDADGFIVWRSAVAGNVELLYLNVREPGKGYGHRLIRILLTSLKKYPPRNAIYGFLPVTDTERAGFFEAMGFDLTEVDGFYLDGPAVLFSQTYAKLCEIHLEK